MRFLPILFSLLIHGAVASLLISIPQKVVQTEPPTIHVQWERSSQKLNTPHPPLRGDLSHKGRDNSYCVKRRTTSPLVGEVASKRRLRDPIKSLQAKQSNPELCTPTSEDGEKKVQRKPYKPLPKYPWICRKRGQEGCASLLIQTNEEGRVVRVSLQKSSGYSSLDQSALDAVKAWILPNAPGQQVVSIAFRLRG